MYKFLLKFLTFCFCFIFGFRTVAEAQYGAPPTLVDIKGKVKDEKNTQMKNIQIKVKNINDSTHYISDTKTDENGNFTINMYDFYLRNELQFEFYNSEDKSKLYDTTFKINREQIKFTKDSENNRKKELKEPIDFKIRKK